MELLRQDLLELGERYGALLGRIHADEVLTDLCALFIGERPGHHLHTAPPELGSLAKRSQGVDHGLVHLALRGRPPLRDPAVLERLRGREPHLGVHLQQGLGEGDGVLRDVGPPLRLHGVPALGDVVGLHRLRAGEGHVARQQDEDDDAEAPEVALAGVALHQHLGGHVGDGAQAGVHLAGGIPFLAEAKVDQLELLAPLPVVQEVL
mmetsp:Transcript_37214/g.106296  ORF Transcript_37214/g.106296 Transcript_37214/m.106296 type:complete len:207 (-) Transcript_37214:132-752(-)